MIALSDTADSLAVELDKEMATALNAIVTNVRVLATSSTIFKLASKAEDGPGLRATLVNEVQPNLKTWKLKQSSFLGVVEAAFSGGLNMVLPK